MQPCYPSNFGCLPGPLSTTCITLQQHFLPSYQKWLYGRRQADQRRRWRTRSKSPDGCVLTREVNKLTQSCERSQNGVSSWWLTCPTTGFWQAEQFPLEDVWTPCRLRSDCSSPSILSSEPPDVGCVGATGCGAAGTTGWTGGAGWENKGKQVNGWFWNKKRRKGRTCYTGEEMVLNSLNGFKQIKKWNKAKHDPLCMWQVSIATTMFYVKHNS